MTEDEKGMRALCHLKAKEVWVTFTKNEKNLVRFGMFPAEKMKLLDSEGYEGRLMACALMDCAKADGGMIA